METVTGIGGVFFKSKDPEGLARWYEQNLGVVPPGASYEDEVWIAEGGKTVFTPFSEDSDFFGPAEQRWGVNFRVRDLDAMVAQLREAGSEVDVDPEDYPNGRFANTHDPDGNPIQLWQPETPPASG